MAHRLSVDIVLTVLGRRTPRRPANEHVDRHYPGGKGNDRGLFLFLSVRPCRSMRGGQRNNETKNSSHGGSARWGDPGYKRQSSPDGSDAARTDALLEGFLAGRRGWK